MSLVLPFAFPPPSGVSNISDSLQAGLQERHVECIASVSTQRHKAVALGCSNGSVYVFRSTSTGNLNSSKASTSPPAEAITLQTTVQPPSPSPRKHRSKSPVPGRSDSPSLGSHLPFVIPPRSRVTSSVTKEQAEAPKNYVDFDEEPGKLKELLKGKTKLSFEESSTTSQSSRPASFISVSSRMKPQEYEERDSPKAVQPASPITYPYSPPVSPAPFLVVPDRSLFELEVAYRVTPRRSGPGTGVSQLEILGDSGLLVMLQRNGDLSIFSLHDGSCVAVARAILSVGGDTGIAHPSSLTTRLQIHPDFERGSFTILVIIGLDSGQSDFSEDSLNDRAHCTLLEFWPPNENGTTEGRLQFLSDWESDGSIGTSGIFNDSEDGLTFFWVNPKNHLNFRKLDVSPSQKADDTKENSSTTKLHLQIPFRIIHNRSETTLQTSLFEKGAASDAWQESQTRDLGPMLSENLALGISIRCVGGKTYALAFSEIELLFLYFVLDKVICLCKLSTSALSKAQWIDDESFHVEYKDRVEVHSFSAIIGRYLKSAGTDTRPCNFPRPQRVIPMNGNCRSFTCGAEMVFVTTEDSCCLVKSNFFNCSKNTVYTLWKAPKNVQDINSMAFSTILPLDLDNLILGYNNGTIAKSTLSRIAHGSEPLLISATPLPSDIVFIHEVRDHRTQRRYILGGGDDGSIAFWDWNSLELRARWTIFVEPLTDVVEFEDKECSLYGCVLCISRDGTTAAIDVDSFHMLYLIPGSAFTLEKIFLDANNLLLMYGNNRSRIWNIKTREFRRVMHSDKAKEMISHEEWIERDIGIVPERRPISALLSREEFDTLRVFTFDLEAFLSTEVPQKKSGSRIIKNDTITYDPDVVRSILSVALTPGLNVEIDRICREGLNIKFSSPVAELGFFRLGCTTVYANAEPRNVWTISPKVTADRALTIVTCLRSLSLPPNASADRDTIVAFYINSLAQHIGTSFKQPDLVQLAKWWFTPNIEPRQSAQLLFEAAIVNLSESGVISLSEDWQHHLPYLQPDADKLSEQASLALMICGYLASEKQSLLSTSALIEISKSIVIYLHSDQPICQVLAIDLCSRGFHVWLHYVDPMETLRSLCQLATSTRKESIAVQNPTQQARLAVLQIASRNTPLFMTTLAADILQPKDTAHRKSIMQLVAFLIKRRPLIILSNLSRLLEAVVKSLDPNVTSSREAVHDAATDILGHVVKTFPSVDFHMLTQRLAVGTTEGAIVMYDLKTATRLYVLEGHKKRLDACSFSPDGRRLVTVSLEEGSVLVWKVGSSFTSFFNPGAPPRQGHSGSAPYKTYPFNVGSQAEMSVEESLKYLSFEWPAERSARLTIRESILTFSAA